MPPPATAASGHWGTPGAGTALGNQIMQLLKMAATSTHLSELGENSSFCNEASTSLSGPFLLCFLQNGLDLTFLLFQQLSLFLLKKIPPASPSEVTWVLTVRLLENHLSALHRRSSAIVTKRDDDGAQFCPYFSSMQKLCVDELCLQVARAKFIYSSILLWIWKEIWTVGMTIRSKGGRLFWLYCGTDDLVGFEDKVVVIKASRIIQI